MLALAAKKKLRASARSLGWPAARAPFSSSCRMVVKMVNSCAFPASIALATSRVFSWVPVERKRTAASVDADATPVLAGTVTRLLSSRRRAILSTIVLVIIPPAGSLKLPPRPLACCATAGGHAASTNRINNPPWVTCNLFLFIIDRFFQLQLQHHG